MSTPEPAPPKVRIAGGPYVTIKMHNDIAKRAAKNKTSLGIELETDWQDAKSYRQLLSQGLRNHHAKGSGVTE